MEVYYELLEDLLHNPEFIYKYRYKYSFPGPHALWTLSPNYYLQDHASKVFIPGALNPGVIREIGFTPTRTFEQAWEFTKRIVGSDPHVVVLPRYFEGATYTMELK